MRYPDRVDRGGRAPAPATERRPFRYRALVVVGIVASALIVLIYPAASTTTDPSLDLVFCTSTIDPKCQPGNLPILIEAGIISGGGTTATTATVAGGAATATLSPGAFTALGILGGASVFGGEAVGPMVLGQAGIAGQVLTTDPAYTSPASRACTQFSSASSITVSQAVALTTTCGPDIQAAYTAGTSTFHPSSLGTVVPGAVTAGTTLAPGSLALTVAGFATASDLQGFRLDLYCRNNVAPFQDVTGGTFAPTWTSTLPTYPTTLACSANNYSPYRLVFTARNGGTPGSGNRLGGAVWGVGLTPLPTGTATITGSLTTTVHCVGPSGPYTVTETLPVSVASGNDMPVPEATCAPGHLATSGGVTFAPTGGSTVDLIPETFAPTEVVDLPDDYPDCFNGSVAGCRLELYKIGLGGQLESCGSIGQLCVGWAQLPDPALSYKCFYGPYEISINACSAYRAPEVGILPNVDENGDWLPVTAPVPTTLPNDTGTGESPGGGTAPDGGLDPNGNATNCWPNGWGVFNPFSWIYESISCAARTLFVPRQSVMIQVATGTQAAYESSVLGYAFEAGDAIVDELPESVDVSCAGPMVVFGAPLDDLGISGSYFPLNSCDEPMATFRTIAYWALPAFTLFGLLFALARYVAAIIGFVGLGTNNSPAQESKVRFE